MRSFLLSLFERFAWLAFRLFVVWLLLIGVVAALVSLCVLRERLKY